MNNKNIEYIGYLAIFLNSMSLLLQIYRMYTTKDTKGISYKWILIAVCSCFLWIIYGINKKVYILLVSSITYIILYLIILYIKYIYEK